MSVKKQKIRIIAIQNNGNDSIELVYKETKERKQTPYNFDSIYIDFNGKYIDLIDTRYYTDKEIKNLAPIRVPFCELEFIQINLEV